MKGKLLFTCAATAGLALIAGIGPVRATVRNIDVGNLYFSPDNTVVWPGDTVKWTLIEGIHTTTSDSTSPKQWDSDTMDTPGQTFSIVFEAADGIGPFLYHCDFHPDSMQGTITQDLPPEFDPLGVQCVHVGQNINFDVTASDPNGQTPILIAQNLPTGATFTDYFNGTGNFDWTPGPSQEGISTPLFVAFYAGQFDTMNVPIVVGECGEGGDTALSTADPVLILSPAGNLSFNVTLVDSIGMPIESSLTVWLDFSEVSGIVGCASESSWPFVFPNEASDANGNVLIAPHAGGCSTDSVKVMTTSGEIARVPIKSLDHSGGLLVSAADFVGDECNDYNNDDTVNTADWDFFEAYIGQSCIDELADYIKVTAYTIPGPGGIIFDDTIQVCVEVVNMLNEMMNLDSVVFDAASFGIAQPWAGVNVVTNVGLPALDIVDVCVDFVVPWVSHGCFRVYVLPSLPASSRMMSLSEADGRSSRPGQAGSSWDGDQLNIDGCPPCGYSWSGVTANDSDGDGVDDAVDLCNDPKTEWCCPVDADGCGTAGTNPCGYDCDQSKRNGDGSAKPTIPRSDGTSGYLASVPVGTEFGDSLFLYEVAFLPEGWSYETSDTGWIHAPGTLLVEVRHDLIVDCEDSARIIFYAYNDAEEYAGEAEIKVFAHGVRGDVDNSGEINVADLTVLVDYLFLGGEAPSNLAAADANNDQSINVADLAYLVDYLFLDGPPPPC